MTDQRTPAPDSDSQKQRLPDRDTEKVRKKGDADSGSEAPLDPEDEVFIESK
jgi:hypothetical protein